MNEQLIELLENENNSFVWRYLKRNYGGNFKKEDFSMFQKYSYFYDINNKVMNVIIFYGMSLYGMDSSKLMEDMHNICKLFQKHRIETVREAIFLSRLYEMNHISNVSIVENLTNRLLLLEQKMAKLESKLI